MGCVRARHDDLRWPVVGLYAAAFVRLDSPQLILLSGLVFLNMLYWHHTAQASRS
jgi:hypothetical protein